MIYALCFGSLITILYFYIVTILFTRNVVVDIDCYNFLNSQLFSPKLWLRSSLTYYGSYCICFEISTFSSKSFSLIKFDLSFEIYAFGLATSHIGVLKKQTNFFWRISALASKMGQIEKNKTRHITLLISLI